MDCPGVWMSCVPVILCPGLNFRLQRSQIIRPERDDVGVVCRSLPQQTGLDSTGLDCTGLDWTGLPGGLKRLAEVLKTLIEDVFRSHTDVSENYRSLERTMRGLFSRMYNHSLKKTNTIISFRSQKTPPGHVLKLRLSCDFVFFLI